MNRPGLALAFALALADPAAAQSPPAPNLTAPPANLPGLSAKRKLPR